LEDSLEQVEQSHNNKICILPWVHQFGTLSGSYGLCCFSEYFTGFGHGKSPLEAFNDDHMKSIRLAMLAGEEVEPCKVCYDWERSGVESPRQRSNKRFFKYTRLYDQTAEDGSVNNPPIYIDFRFGNLCNFTCRMCGAFSSSSWAKEAKHHGYLDESAPNHYDHWTNNESFWRDIDKFKEYIKVIYFAGGEPFVQEGHYKLLEFLVKNNCTDIELNYNTNLSYERSLKSYDIEELWSNFSKVGVWPSIEGYKEKAEYNRKGLEWDLFCKNVDRFDKYITTFSMLSNVYTITSNLETIKYLKSLNKNFHITNLVGPSHLSTTIFSKDVKKSIMSNYKNELYDMTNILERDEMNCILDSLRHMNSSDDSHLQKLFKHHNRLMDRYRNESFECVFPELAEWYLNI